MTRQTKAKPQAPTASDLIGAALKKIDVGQGKLVYVIVASFDLDDINDAKQALEESGELIRGVGNVELATGLVTGPARLNFDV